MCDPNNLVRVSRKRKLGFANIIYSTYPHKEPLHSDSEHVSNFEFDSATGVLGRYKGKRRKVFLDGSKCRFCDFDLFRPKLEKCNCTHKSRTYQLKEVMSDGILKAMRQHVAAQALVKMKHAHLEPHADMVVLQNNMIQMFGCEPETPLTRALKGIPDVVWGRSKKQMLDFTEALVLSLTQLCYCDSLIHFGSILLSFCKMVNPDKTLIESFDTHIVRKFFYEPEVRHNVQEMTFVPHSDIEVKEITEKIRAKTEQSKPQWLTELKSLKSNWTELLKGTGQRQLSNLLSLFVSFGFCSLEKCKFSVYGFELISSDLIKIHTKASDVVCAVFDSIIYMAEGGWRVYTTGSITSFVMGNYGADDLQERYIQLMYYWNLVKDGNLRASEQIEDVEFYHLLESVLKDCKAARLTLKGFENKMMTDYIMSIERIKIDFTAKRRGGGNRYNPFGIQIYGLSSQGKSDLQDQLLDAVMTSANLPIDRERRQPIDVNSEFMDTWQSDTLVGIFPDFANEKSNFVSSPLTRKLLDFFSPERFVVNKADLPSKGLVEVNAKIGVINTNKLDLDAHIYSNLPYSIQRRPSVIIEVFAKERFQLKRNGVLSGVDSAAVFEYEREHPDHVFSDIWDINILDVSAPKNQGECGQYKITVHNGKRMAMVSLAELINYTTEKFLAWDDNQKTILAKGDARLEYLKGPREEIICGVDGCPLIKCICPKHGFKPLAHDSYKTTVNNGDEETSDDKSKNRRQRQKQNRARRNPGIVAHSNVTTVEEEDESVEEEDEPVTTILVDDSNRPLEWLRFYGSHPRTVTDGERSITYQTDWIHPGDQVRFDWTIGSSLTPILNWTGQAENVISALKWFWWLNNKTRHVPTFPEVATSVVHNHFNWLLDLFHRFTVACFVTSLLFNLVVVVLFVWNIDNLILRTIVVCVYSTISFYLHVNMARIVGRSYLHYYYRNIEERWISAMGAIHSRGSVRTMAYVFPILAGVVGLWKLWKFFRNKAVELEPQGNLAPTSSEEIDERLEEENPYKEVSIQPLSTTQKSACITLDVLQKKLAKNQFFAEVTTYFKRGNAVVEGNGNAIITFVETNFFIMNKHYFNPLKIGDIFEKVELVVHRVGIAREAVGKTMKIVVQPRHLKYDEESDVATCYTPVGGSFGNIIDYLPTEYPSRPHNGKFVFIRKDHTQRVTYHDYKGDSSTMVNGKALIGPQLAYGQRATISGVSTEPGMCGCAYLSQGKAPCVVGIHAGGYTGSSVAGVAHVKRGAILEHIQLMCKDMNVFRTACDDNYDFTFDGVKYGTPDNPHPRSAVNYLAKENFLSNVIYHGTTGKVAKVGTNYKSTAIRKIVAEEANVPDVWRPPKMTPSWYPWQKTLQGLDDPVGHYDADILLKAAEDYFEMIEPSLHKDFWQEVCPLMDDVNLKGYPGKRFWEGMNMSTKYSFHKAGKKSKFREMLEASPLYQHNWKFKDEEERAIVNFIVSLAIGRRGYPVAKGTFKDEVRDKDACRVMYSNSTIFTYVLRWLFLPIIIGIQCDPLTFGVAVGINRQSPEWEQMENYLNEIAGGWLGGDYSKYDQNNATQAILTAFGIYIEIAKRLPGYHSFHIHLMEMIVADLAYAIIDMGGSLVSLTSSGHISGNSLTTHVNSTVNHLLLRYCWFTHNDRPFHNHNRVIVYGDDNKGKSEYGNNFDNKVVAEILAEKGLGYTNPDKGAEVKPWLNGEDLEFLKCKSIYKPEINCTTGALALTSMYRPLMAVIDNGKSGLTDAERDGQNIDNFCRELFHHGRDIWDQEYPKIRRIITRGGLENYVDIADKDFDWHVANWKSRYKPDT